MDATGILAAFFMFIVDSKPATVVEDDLRHFILSLQRVREVERLPRDMRAIQISESEEEMDTGVTHHYT